MIISFKRFLNFRLYSTYPLQPVNQNLIYLDYNSTTPVDTRVLDAMMPYLIQNFGNASSGHVFGKIARIAVEESRSKVAKLLGSLPNEIIFTSGATEATNLGLKGAALANQTKGQHIVTVQTEHKAVLDTCNYLEHIGFEITYLPVEDGGLLDIDDLKRALRSDTSIVAVMYVNNETGVIQRIQEIAEIVHSNGSFLFTDATQAVGKCPLDVEAQQIDLLSFSAHKFYGPKGVGGLYVRKNLKLDAQIQGGGHEMGLRSGTLNVAGIVGMGKACDVAQAEMQSDSIRIQHLRDKLEQKLLKIESAFVNGNRGHRLFNVTNMSFPEVDTNVLIGQLKNVAVSNGSACTSFVNEPSHVLKAMGLTDEEALEAIRFSLGKFTTGEDIDRAVEAVKQHIYAVRY